MTEKKLTINELRAGTKSSRAFRIGVVAVIAAVAAAGVWYFGFADKVKAPTYRTVEITRGPLEVTVVANGTVNPVRTVSIGSELSGIVRKVNVDVNSVVKAGDVLKRLWKPKQRCAAMKSSTRVRADVCPRARNLTCNAQRS